MDKFLIFIGMTFGSYLGWWLGSFQGIYTAIIGSAIFGILGIFAGWKMYDQFLR